jgi:peroxiredoxin
MLALGERAPNFHDLLGTDGKRYSLETFSSKPVLVVIFSCNHCPYVQAYEDRMVQIQGEYSGKGVQLLAINSNNSKAYPEDSYEKMIVRAKEKKFNFPYVRDEDQSVANSFGAVCTPHVFAFDADRTLRYRGRIDDSRDPNAVKSHDLRNALDDLASNRQVRVADTKPFGCSIKWIEA